MAESCRDHSHLDGLSTTDYAGERRHAVDLDQGMCCNWSLGGSEDMKAFVGHSLVRLDQKDRTAHQGHLNRPEYAGRSRPVTIDNHAHLPDLGQMRCAARSSPERPGFVARMEMVMGHLVHCDRFGCIASGQSIPQNDCRCSDGRTG